MKYLIDQLMVLMNFLINWVYLEMSQVRFYNFPKLFIFQRNHPKKNVFTDVRVESSLHFMMGLCFTINPLVKTRGAWKDYGYSIMLEHNLTDNSQSLLSSNPGWHVFIHEGSEKFSGKPH